MPRRSDTRPEDLADLKARVFDLLEGTYGMGVAAITREMAVPASRARQAVRDLLAEGRLWKTDGGRYRCVLPPPPWCSDVLDSLACLGVAALAYRYVPEDRHLELFPAPFFQAGDPSGEVYYSGSFDVELHDLAALFDAPPVLVFGPDPDGTSISLEGTIGGEDAWIEVRDRPPEDEPPRLVMTRAGRFGILDEDEPQPTAAARRPPRRIDPPPPGCRGLWVPDEHDAQGD